MTLLLALSIGFAAGLRSMTAPAAVSWAARMGWLPLGGTGLAFLAHPVATAILTLAAIGEYVGDKLPNAPARTSPPGFITRLVVGGLCGAAIFVGHGVGAPLGVLAGVLGAVAGTLGGYAYRMKVPRALRLAGFPFAVLEDLAAIALALFVVSRTDGPSVLRKEPLRSGAERRAPFKGHSAPAKP